MAFGLSAGSAALLGAVAGPVIGGLIGSNASKSAGQTQADAANRATDTQLQMFNTQNAQAAPYRETGQSGLWNLNYLLGNTANATSDSTVASAIGMGPDGKGGGMGPGALLRPFSKDDLQTNLAPNYQFMLDQGLGAVKNAGNLAGGMSGNTLKGINDYAQNYAGNAYQNAFNNYNANQTNIFNRLSTIAGLGSAANAQSSSLAGTLAPSIAGTQVGAGAAQAAGTVGSANAISGGINNAMGWYTLNNLTSKPGNAGSENAWNT